MSEFRETLRAARTGVGLSQREVADAMGTSQSAVSELENGIGEPTLPTLVKWATVLGFDVQLVKRAGAS